MLEFIAIRITNNIRELEGALIRVTAYASLNSSSHHRLAGRAAPGRAPAGLGRAHRLDAGPSSRSVAEYYRQPVELLRGKSRQRPLVLARQIAMYVMRDLTDLSYPAIAREFGGRDHTTVIHAVSKVEKLMKERQQVYDQVTFLINQLKNGGRRTRCLGTGLGTNGSEAGDRGVVIHRRSRRRRASPVDSRRRLGTTTPAVTRTDAAKPTIPRTYYYH